MMESSPFDPDDWLLHELTQQHVKIDRTSFPGDSREAVFAALDTILELAVFNPQDDPLAFATCSAFILFPRLIACFLPPGCNAKHASHAFARRCKMFMEGQVAELLHEVQDSQVTIVACRVHALM
jgi:hypothetical protein